MDITRTGPTGVHVTLPLYPFGFTDQTLPKDLLPHSSSSHNDYLPSRHSPLRGLVPSDSGYPSDYPDFPNRSCPTRSFRLGPTKWVIFQGQKNPG